MFTKMSRRKNRKHLGNIILCRKNKVKEIKPISERRRDQNSKKKKEAERVKDTKEETFSEKRRYQNS
jgi:hypothetical protein